MERKEKKARCVIAASMSSEPQMVPRSSPLYYWKPLFVISFFFGATLSSPAHGDERKRLIKVPYVPAHVKEDVAAANMLQP